MGTSEETAVLLVENAAGPARALSSALAERGFQVHWAKDALAAYPLLQTAPVDIAILDIGLPRISGLMLLRMLRGSPRTKSIPILMTAASRDEALKADAFRAGADDYMTKPLAVWELAARMEAVLRRARGGSIKERALEAEDIRLSLERRRVTAQGREVPLTPCEFHLLAALLRRRGQLLDRGALAESLPEDARKITPNALYVHMRNLRAKLGRAGRAIETRYGEGYRFCA